MLKIKIIRKKLSKSGQINIAETVVSATIILVLAVSVAQLGSRVALSQQTNSMSTIQEKAQQTLDLCQSLGYLRQLAYATNPSGVAAYNYTFALLTSNLPTSAQFSVYQYNPQNKFDANNNRVLVGLSPVPSGSLNIFSVSDFVSGYYNSTQFNTNPYVVTLIVAVGDA